MRRCLCKAWVQCRGLYYSLLFFPTCMHDDTQGAEVSESTEAGSLLTETPGCCHLGGSMVLSPCANEKKENSVPWESLSKLQRKPPISGQGHWLLQMETWRRPPRMPPAWCPHIDHSCPALQEARPECSELLERESQPRWETNAYYPLLFLPLYREEASLYRSLHFRMCIQGHFLNQSIEQSEYAIFMSQCILELKYMDGNKNSKALKKWQPR